MVKKSKKKAPSKAKPVEVPPPSPPRVSFHPGTRKSSVIMLSSPESSFDGEPSVILNEPSITIIDLARPSTRMSNVEMDMTDFSDPRFSTRSPLGDNTDLSLTNIIQTPGVYRERPKSSWVIRRTRSKSMGPPLPPPPPLVQEEIAEGRPSRVTQFGDFVTVTRQPRNIRRPARYLDGIDENRASKSRVQKKLAVVPETPRVERNNGGVEANTPAATPAISRVTKRKRNVPKETVAGEVSAAKRRSNEEQPAVSQTTSDEDSNKSLESPAISMVSIRRRRPLERPPSPEYPPEVEEPTTAAPSESVTVSVERPPSPEYPPEEPVVEPIPTAVIRPRARSASRRRRLPPAPSPECPPETVIEPTPVPAIRSRTRSASRSRHQPSSESVARSRPRTRTASRSRQTSVEKQPPEHPQESDVPPSSRSRSRQPRSRKVVQSPETAVRQRTSSASHGRSQPVERSPENPQKSIVEPSPEKQPAEEPSRVVRQRARSASRNRPEESTVEPKVRSRARSASRARPKKAAKKVSESEAGPAPGRGRTRTRSEHPPSRSKSAAEPAPKLTSTRSRSASREHVPVYRLPIQVPAVAAVKAVAVAAPMVVSEQDVYEFDSPGLLEGPKVAEGKKGKRKGGAAKNPTRGKRTTPAKKVSLVTALYGTDMHKITRVVKKIGGGPVKRPPTPLQTVSRSTSPVLSNYDPVDENHHFGEDDLPEENVEPEPVPPPVKMVNPLIERVLQQRPITPDQTAPANVTLGFSPLGASSPWRVQNENVLPRTFYFSRSKDLLPSYESDVVVRDENVRPKTPVAEPVPEPAPVVSPVKQPSAPATAPITGAKVDAMFQGIQKSYEQLKVTSEMSNKLITAMRKYKATTHNQSLASVSASGELPEDERLIAKFREYEANMKKTYQKLKQWYERSQQQLTHSIKTIEQVSAVPKTLAQRQVLDNFRRDSKVFLTMMNDLESAMNDSNVENVSPPAQPDKSTFKDVVILTERNMGNRNRSPLKTLEIANVPSRFSPIKSPLVRNSFTTYPAKPKPAAAATSTIEISSPPTEDNPKKDLFGFETDDSDPAPPTTAATPIKITKETLKERLESVRKMLPQRPPSTRTRREPNRMPTIIGSPTRKQPRSVQSVFASSTPVALKRTITATVTTRRDHPADDVADLSAIADEPATAAPSPPPVALFDDVASTTLSAVNRTYSRVPRRNHKRKRNVYLADLGLSDDDNEEEAEEDNEAEVRKQANKKRRVAAGKKKVVVEETNEFKQFVSEFNSMCEEVDRYKLVIEKPAGGVRQRV